MFIVLTPFFFFIFSTFLFCSEVSPINNAVILLSEQGRNSVSILPQTAFPSKLPHNIEQSSIRYTVEFHTLYAIPCWVSILITVVHTYPSCASGKELPAMAGDVTTVLGWGKSSGEGIATHPSILAWRTPWTEEPSGLQSIGSQRVRHD